MAAFESRHAEEMTRLIERHRGVPHVSPSMREVSAAGQRQALDFVEALLAERFDAVVFMTGVGVRKLWEALDLPADRAHVVERLRKLVTIARGPKPSVVLKELGLEPTIRVPEPNTWRELLATLDEKLPLAGRRLAVLEYGQPNPELLAGLQARGAAVTAVKIYDWDLPEETGPLEENARRLAAGQIEVAMFTSSQQLAHLLLMAQRLGIESAVHAGLRRAVVASIGPTTTETLARNGVSVDIEPEHPKMGHLVAAAAAKADACARRKREILRVVESESSGAATAEPRGWDESPFMRACRRQTVECTPVWLMRQAGRYMPEYRAVREKTTFLQLCKDPALCAEVMITAVNRLGVDAAIIFADLLPILEPMGFDLEFAPGEGPMIHNPVRDGADVDRVAELEHVESLGFVMETVRLTRAGLPERIPVIGFAGAPFTLASYAVEGGGSRNYLNTKALMYRDAGAWHELMGRLARSVARHLTAQIAAGAQAVQLFDSWVGCLGPDDYRRYVLPHTQTVMAALPRGVPVIHFGAGNPALLPLLREAGGDVLGIDWRLRLDDAWRTVGYDRAVQGNLDPLALLAEPVEIRRRVQDVLHQAGGRPGHVFNLGHGIVPQTPVDHVVALVEMVHELGRRRPA